ncbi:diacylglycerol O-acyltransferase [Knoellia sinensis KCTC 19936]|uniref:Diacylglycerol O-acyltransferase n=1 Tax=Knoellia sinensis KCTC 19936 TaxID=1385520 RepID=A0A0A0J8D8_9MICO|nr:wax ester/triacylglycerol synthase family O-acyltransferase [Knoellia sinensis]KGN32322.1 diacylglycerol O-acyltransferase [Knoellia sinensis KCTC 19936]
MSDRLSTLDNSFLALEDPTTPMHVGSVMVFDAPTEGFDYDRLVGIIARRIAYVPRYRQRVRTVPGRVANPVWIDDERFDVTYHVRRSALPRPGGDEQLEELIARIQPRPLDRTRPLWEVYLVEGLAEDRFAIITKTHQALVDGVNAVDIAHLILEDSQTPSAESVDDTWRPSREPSHTELVVSALADSVRTPSQIVDTVQSGITDVKATAGRLLGTAGEVASTLARASTSPAPTSPLNARIGKARRFVMVGTDLDDYKKIRSRLTKGAFADDVTINDVILATITGAFRTWLMTRGESVHGGTTIRAMVPVSVHDEEGDPSNGRQLDAAFVDLPVGEPGASMRLHQIAFAMRQQIEAGRAVGADTLSGLGGFAPPTMHTLAARLGGAMSRRLYNVAITNVPGPQHPLYIAGAQMVSTYPVMPLSASKGLSIGLTSYDGGVYYGLYADRDALPDTDVLGQSIVDGLQELLEAPRSRAR